MNYEEYQNVLALHRVPVTKLHSSFDEQSFSFETTDDLEKMPNQMIGQNRAEQAMEFGLSVEQSGYNLFVVGPAGTGKMTYTLDSITKLAKQQKVPDDWCYVYNFENPDMPTVIPFPAGTGQQFQREMEILLIDIERELKSAFNSEIFEKNKRNIIEEIRTKMGKLWEKIDEFALQNQVKIERTPQGLNTIPLYLGRPITMQEYESLSDSNKEMLKERERLVEEKIQETVYQIRKLDEQLRKTMNKFMRETAAYAIEGLFQPLREKYQHHKKVLRYFDSYFYDVVEHYSFFLDDGEDDQNIIHALVGTSTEKKLNRYTVNLFVNNRNIKGAPVIYETHPTYHNLFGKVEYQGALGNWITDFTFIKPGVLHLANGGYLILQATELLQEPNAWTRLKRTLQTNSIQIENPYEDRAAIPTSGLRPESIPLNLKVIIIGPYYLYDLLSAYDEDFHKLFKVKVEFGTEMEKTEENCLKMARFVKNFADKEGLLPFHRRAIAKVINYSSRLVEDQTKLSTQFQEISKILVESSYWAKKENCQYVDAPHVVKALTEKSNRSNHVIEQYRELIKNGTIMVETDGYRIGQINGLAVMGTRDSVFGIPTKITAQTYVGKSGIMNIEREAALSGQIHNKGMMILTGFLSGEFAKNRPIPLSASITFEQTYSQIDGDSASSTELYVLLSSLAEVPIYQGIAVTGSVNQWGEIQPIGGVNEKIEGFYHICKERGLTGKQGVIIPKQNVANLMLEDEVVEAVREGRFHVWSVEHIAEGIEILTGVRAGNIRDENGQYPSNTIFAKVEDRFKKMYESLKEQRK
ncbi:AAA family ATPase [Caldibacillus thermoamylovorans]|uniref:Lon protease family protein n=1 Tax=Caldibacillus thermoamylovorans TaxID=35841 RepID=UPI001D0690A2|nr:ATP-binding protein [Caldibacillus thermoamylovorans]MCB5934853.1 AAA family ATPase [Bacillus sp. DFI.2.34]MCB7076059.1 AAA family ATPase [Caldibacillus thermoamylovorans]